MAKKKATKKAKKKRKPSAFNKRVGKLIKGGMTFKQAVKAAKKGGSSTKASTKKKATTTKGSNPKGGKTTTNKKSNGQGAAFKKYAILGNIADMGTRVMVGRNTPEEAFNGIIEAYTGFNIANGKVEASGLSRGYGGSIVEGGYRKFAKAAGFRPYPRKEIKTFKDVIENIAMHGNAVIIAAANKDDLNKANREIYRNYFGVNLGKRGFEAFQLGHIIGSKGLYSGVKIGTKVLKDVFGVDLNTAFN